MTALVKTRFAPSPTGLVHLGNIRTALFNALWARAKQGIFLLRIEDTDRDRSDEQYVNALQEDLRWLLLDWQEGVGDLHDGGKDQGNFAPYRQSQRAAIYEKYFQVLLDRGHAYPCFCTEQELKLSRKAQRTAGQAPRYSGKCAHLSAQEVSDKMAQGLASTLRFQVPAGQTVSFEDSVRGVQKFLTDDIGDFIIRRGDGTSAFFFTNAIDDALMQVSHVLRGEDHLTNTPRQILLLQELGLNIPEYGHISMIVGNDGAPLSKRHGSKSIQDLRKAGYLPGAVLNYLARLGHHYVNNGWMELEQLAENFSLQSLGHAPARYDQEQLGYWQKEALKHCDEAALWQWLGEKQRNAVPTERQSEFLQTVLPNISFPEDVLPWIAIVFTPELVYRETEQAMIMQAGKEFFRAALDALQQVNADFKALTGQVKQATGAKGKALFMPLRIALSGEQHGPEMGKLLPLLGSEVAALRFQRCIDLCSE